MNFTDEEKAKIKKWAIIALFAVVSVFTVFAITSLYRSIKAPQSAPQEMKYSDTTNENKMQKKLNITPKESSEIVKEIQYIHDGKQSPSVTYQIQSPDLQTAADTTTKQIAQQDSSLPKEALEKTDRTVVTANTDKQVVDVYKINLRNNHKIKAGTLVTYDNGSMRGYVGAGYQAGRVEAMAYYGGGTHYAGTVNYTLKEW